MSALAAAASDEDGDIIKTLQARVADLEAQLYAFGAGGVGSTVARQDHPEQHLNMVPVGWKLVPVEPSPEMVTNGAVESYGPLLAGIVYQERVRRAWQAMLAAAPQPPAVKESLTVEQPQVEQEPVAWAEEIIEFLHAHYDTEMIKELDSGDELIRLDDAISAVEEVAQRYTRPQPKGEQEPVVWMDADARVFYDHDTSEVDRYLGFKPTVPLYAHPQPKREPLTDDAATRLVQSVVAGSDRPIGMVEFGLLVARSTERAHGIGGDA